MSKARKKIERPNLESKSRDPDGKKTCALCHETKYLTDFYYSASPMCSLDQRIPFCKECCKSYPLAEDGSINYIKFKDLLIQVDKPLYYDELQRAINIIKKNNPYLSDREIKRKGSDIVVRYFQNVAMRNNIGKGFSDSEKDGFIGNKSGKTKKEISNLVEIFEPRFITGRDETDTAAGVRMDDFEVTQEMVDLFGDGYSVAEYRKMNEKYQSLRQNYQIQTSLHQEALITYVRFKVKEEAATVDGNVDEAKKWYDAAQNAADKAKLSPKQLTKADLQKGLNSFSEISQALEQAVDIIEILPRYKNQPQDSVDFNIWCYINYARRLKGLPDVEYSEVYHFYDEMKEEYLSQYGDPYGIFKNDTTIENRDNIEKFITLPADYEDIEYNDSEDDEE